MGKEQQGGLTWESILEPNSDLTDQPSSFLNTYPPNTSAPTVMPEITSSVDATVSTAAAQEKRAGDSGDGSLLRWVKPSTCSSQPSIAAGPVQSAALPSPKM